jgi:glycosyltransferase involved in cell wall biosynthesis
MPVKPSHDTPWIDIVHLAYTVFPADTRVKREALAAASTGRSVAVVALRAEGQPEVEAIGPVTVVRLPGGKSRAGPLRYVAEYVSFTWRCRRLLARDSRFRHVRLVHVHTLPDFLAWSAAPAQRRGARLILDLHEIFPEFTAVKYPGFPGRIAAAFARRVERAARRRADLTITVNTPIDTLLSARAIGRLERRIVVHNSTDPGDFGPSVVPTARALHAPLELVYHGTLTPLYGLDTAVHGVVQAARAGRSVHLCIIGEGPARPALERLVGELQAASLVTFEPPLPQHALRERLHRADAGIVPTRLDAMTRYSLSNKLLEYVHLGIPLLAARLPSYQHYLSDAAAWYCEPNDPADLARAIGRFAGSTAEARRSRAAQAQHELERISWPHERDRLVGAYEELLAGDAASSAAIFSAARPSP